MNYDGYNLLGTDGSNRITQERNMDYSELIIRLNQRLKSYQDAVNKKDLPEAKLHAAVILELADELLFVTRAMK